MSLDGYVARPNGELDWMTWDHDDKILQLVNSLIDSSDTILLGRKMTDGFVSHWENVVNNKPESPVQSNSKKEVMTMTNNKLDFSFAKKMVDTPKIAFSKTQKSVPGKNVAVENGDLVTAVKNLKSKDGKDIIVYGGAGFVSSLIKEGLIDEYHLLVHPTAIGNGMTIFKSLDRTQKFSAVESRFYSCGITVLSYKPKND